MRPFVLLSLLIIFSCKKEKTESNDPGPCIFQCGSRPIDVFLHKSFYTPEEMDTVIIREYEGDGSFTSLIKETIDTGYSDTIRSNTSFSPFVTGNHLEDVLIYGDSSDYEIVIPGAGQTYRIWDVAPTPASEERPADWCISGGGGHPPPCSYPVKDFEISGGKYSRDIYDGYSYYHNTITLKY